VAWLVGVSVLASHGDDDAGTATPLAGDAATLLRQSQAAMLELDSFQLDSTNPSDGEENTYRSMWQSPDSVHVLYPNDVVHYETGQEPMITHRGFVEGIVIGDTIYVRQCAAEGEDCQSWEEKARGRIYISGPWGQLDPPWTVDLLGLLSDAQIVGKDDVDGVACTRIRGRADVVQATVRSFRRAEESRGPLDWGEECTGRATTVDGKRVEECNALTLDEYAAKIEESAVEEGLSGPFPVEVWVEEDDRRMRRVDLLGDTEVAVTSFTFSRFDEVTVEPPK